MMVAQTPYMHRHARQAQKSRDRYISLDVNAQAQVIAFLNSLGGASQKTAS